MEYPIQPLKPHDPDTRIVLRGGLPKLLVTPNAMMDMACIVDEAKHEVGWLGEVVPHGKDYLLTDVHLFDQEANGHECDITAASLADFADKLMQQDGGHDRVNNLRLWGHSHVNMACSPSKTDNDTLEELWNACGDHFIRVICNKRGDMRVTICLPACDIVDASWSVFDPADHTALRAYWRHEIHEKVKEPVHRYVTPYQQGAVVAGGQWVKQAEGHWTYHKPEGLIDPRKDDLDDMYNEIWGGMD